MDEQVPTSGPESRHMIVRNNVTEAAYNLQSTVDAGHNIPIDYLVTASDDTKAMGGMPRRAKAILKTNDFTALYHKGYHTGSEFRIASDLNITALVAVPGIGRASQAPDPAYNEEHFAYNPGADAYTCPQGNMMTSNGSWHTTRNYRFKQYRTKACRDCPVRERRTTAKRNGKTIQRSEFKQFIEDNAGRVGEAGTFTKEGRPSWSIPSAPSKGNGASTMSSPRGPRPGHRPMSGRCSSHTTSKES